MGSGKAISCQITPSCLYIFIKSKLFQASMILPSLIRVIETPVNSTGARVAATLARLIGLARRVISPALSALGKSGESISNSALQRAYYLLGLSLDRKPDEAGHTRYRPSRPQP